MNNATDLTSAQRVTLQSALRSRLLALEPQAVRRASCQQLYDQRITWFALSPRDVQHWMEPMAKLNGNDRDAIPSGKFAFPAGRREPLENPAHVRNAIARFNQVQGVSDAERSIAWQRILTAAEKYGVEVHEASLGNLGAHLPRKT